MKCPKCGYLGFEQVDRCRNCGYDFSLTKPPAEPDLSLKPPDSADANPADDFAFLKEASPGADPPSVSPTPVDLPLFARRGVDDAPLITTPSPPRAPLAVRRATPDAPRVRTHPRAQSFELGLDASSPAPARSSVRRAGATRVEHETAAETLGEDAAATAGLASRFLAAAIDLFILGIVDFSVVYFTMQISGIELLDLPVLPKWPLLIFLLIQNGGYLVAFTAGGQTLGKMALGIRVVAAADAEPVGLVRAGVRTLLWALLAIPAGLGFLTALFTADRRGLHDRLAGTRVVRASA
jgi:uncharacterized RDD family membrane protein YckC